ncbi:MAG TPA: hypothetical protein EYF95_05700 [Flavobacteriales bacterium]|jgi:DNA mismatch repair protein MutH|nr:hypothetical protein [Flavobacteriales bacterium]
MTNTDPDSIKMKILKERHQQLDDDADELSARSYLSQVERDRLKILKVMRLRCKDAMDAIRMDEDCLLEAF